MIMELSDVHADYATNSKQSQTNAVCVDAKENFAIFELVQNLIMLR